jgi:hypothetical protein
MCWRRCSTAGTARSRGVWREPSGTPGQCPFSWRVRAPKGGNKPTALLHGTSLFDVRSAMPERLGTISTPRCSPRYPDTVNRNKQVTRSPSVKWLGALFVGADGTHATSRREGSQKPAVGPNSIDQVCDGCKGCSRSHHTADLIGIRSRVGIEVQNHFGKNVALVTAESRCVLPPSLRLSNTLNEKRLR